MATSEEAPEVKIEPEPLSPEEAFGRYVAVLEKQSASAAFEEFPAYDVEMVSWAGKVGQNASRVKLSKRVRASRAILKTLLTFRGILNEFEEEEPEPEPEGADDF